VVRTNRCVNYTHACVVEATLCVSQRVVITLRTAKLVDLFHQYDTKLRTSVTAAVSNSADKWRRERRVGRRAVLQRPGHSHLDNFELPSVILARHTSLFLDKLRHCNNCLIKNVMRTELTCSVLISFILFVVILRLFNLFKALYNVLWICRERTAKTVNCYNYSYFV